MAAYGSAMAQITTMGTREPNGMARCKARWTSKLESELKPEGSNRILNLVGTGHLHPRHCLLHLAGTPLCFLLPERLCTEFGLGLFHHLLPLCLPLLQGFLPCILKFLVCLLSSLSSRSFSFRSSLQIWIKKFEKSICQIVCTLFRFCLGCFFL